MSVVCLSVERSGRKWKKEMTDWANVSGRQNPAGVRRKICRGKISGRKKDGKYRNVWEWKISGGWRGEGVEWDVEKRAIQTVRCPNFPYKIFSKNPNTEPLH